MHTQRSAHLQQGLTLTESLTALVLLSIGVLCIATVYLERTQAAPAVLLHSKASRLAAEMAERMRTQRTDKVHYENPVGVRCDPQLTNGAPQQQVDNDIACWQDKIGQTLPNGSGAVAHESQAPLAYLITVSWTPPKRGTASYLLRVPVTNTTVPQSSVTQSAFTQPANSATVPPKPTTTLPPAATDAARAAN